MIEHIFVVLLMLYIAYLQKLHYDERKELYKRINTPISEIDREYKPKPVKSASKKWLEAQHKGGE